LSTQKKLPLPFYRVSTRSALIAVFVGLSLGTNYALSDLPNVKFMDSFDFIATYLFGLSIGLPVVILTRTIYALVNPWGPASGWLIALLVLGDCFYAIAGLFARRVSLLERNGEAVQRSLKLGLLGLFSALAFDLMTNIGSGLLVLTGPTPQVWLGRAVIWGLITMNFPLPLGILHEVTDFLFFATLVPASILLLRRSIITDQTTLPGLSVRNGSKTR